MNCYDHIEAYLNGELSGDDLGAFEEALRNDTALQLAVKRHQTAIAQLHALRLRGKIRENMVPPTASGATGQSFAGWLRTAAAVVTVVVVATYFIYIRKETTLMADKPDREDTPARGDTDTDTGTAVSPADIPQKEPENGTGGIRKKNIALYRETVGTISNISYTYLEGQGQKDNQHEARLNGIIDLLRNNRPEKAIPLLEELLDNRGLPEAYREDAEWLLSVALITEDEGESREILEKITGNPAHSCRVKAVRLLEKLEQD